MTPPDLAARVAALLDAGDPGHVRDLYEDLAVRWGETRAARAVWEAVIGWRTRHVLAGGVEDETLRQARRLCCELVEVMSAELIEILQGKRSRA